MSTLSEAVQRRNAQRQAMITIGDLLEQDLPLATWSVAPLLGSAEVIGYLWDEQDAHLAAWAEYLGAPIQAESKGRTWSNSVRGTVDGTAVSIFCDLPYDLAARLVLGRVRDGLVKL